MAYNPSDGLTGVLDALRGQSRLPECVVVVDNGSQPPIDASRWPESWHLIRLEENSGVGKGHNAGLRWAKERGFRWAWLLEHDDIPLSDCLAALTRHASDLAIADESWGVVYPKNVRSMAESRFVGSDREPADENFYDPGLRDNDRGITLLPAFRFTFNGPLVAVDRVLEIGGLREDLFVGHEDWDLSDRLRSRETGLYYA